MMDKFRIVIADDHPIILNGLRTLIEAENDFEIVGEASNGTAALKTIREQKPHVAVVDISMPELNGILLGRRLTDEMPAVKLIVLTLHENRAFLTQALNAGIKGYILKRSAAEILVQAIRAVIFGGVYVDPAIADLLLERSPRCNIEGKKDTGAVELTERESEVLKLRALGLTNKEIARKLDIGVKSIETYRARGFEKLGLKTRVELVRFASTQGWLADL